MNELELTVLDSKRMLTVNGIIIGEVLDYSLQANGSGEEVLTTTLTFKGSITVLSAKIEGSMQ